MSLRRQNPWMKRNIAARDLFLAAMVILPAYLLHEDLVVRVAQVVLLAAAALLAGKRIFWLYFASVTLAVTAIHLLIPTGRVLFDLGPLPVTSGALRAGLFKGLSINGLVFLSLAGVRADLRLPGRLGPLVGDTFFAFEMIMARRPRLSRSGVIPAVDALLTQISGELGGIGTDLPPRDAAERHSATRRTSALGWAVLAVAVSLQWGAYLVTRRPG